MAFTSEQVSKIKFLGEKSCQIWKVKLVTRGVNNGGNKDDSEQYLYIGRGSTPRSYDTDDSCNFFKASDFVPFITAALYCESNPEFAENLGINKVEDKLIELIGTLNQLYD